MPTLDARPRKTKDDFAALPETTRAELIGGEIYVSPAPRKPHQHAVGVLYRALHEHLTRRSAGEVWLSPFDVHLPSGDVVEPDLIVVLTPNLHIVQDWIYGVPDLLIEIVSPSRPMHDRVVKRALYADNGVREYWIVDPDERTVEVLGLAEGAWRPAGFFAGEATLQSQLLPEFALALPELFAD